MKEIVELTLKRFLLEGSTVTVEARDQKFVAEIEHAGDKIAKVADALALQGFFAYRNFQEAKIYCTCEKRQ